MKINVELETEEEINNLLKVFVDKNDEKKDLPSFPPVIDKPVINEVEPQRVEQNLSVEKKVDKKGFFNRKKPKVEVVKEKDDLMGMMFKINEIHDKDEIEAVEKIVAERKNEIQK